MVYLVLLCLVCVGHGQHLVDHHGWVWDANSCRHATLVRRDIAQSSQTPVKLQLAQSDGDAVGNPQRAFALLLFASDPAVGWHAGIPVAENPRTIRAVVRQASASINGPSLQEFARCVELSMQVGDAQSRTLSSGTREAAQLSRRILLQSITSSILIAMFPSPTVAEEMQPAQMTPGTVMIRVAQVTEVQENLLRRYADMTPEQRQQEFLIIPRKNMEDSVGILLKNSKLYNLPGCEKPAMTLKDISNIAENGSGELTRQEVLAMADRYARARDELGVAFTKLTKEEQGEASDVARRLKVLDDERIAAR